MASYTNESYLSDGSDKAAQPQKTMISFILKENKNTEQKDKLQQVEQENRHRYSRSILLSILYAFVLVLIGICFPISEAIQNCWYAHHVVGAYMTYLFSVSMLFLIYLQTTLSIQKRKVAKQDAEKKQCMAEELVLNSLSTPNDNKITTRTRKVPNQLRSFNGLEGPSEVDRDKLEIFNYQKCSSSSVNNSSHHASRDSLESIVPVGIIEVKENAKEHHDKNDVDRHCFSNITDKSSQQNLVRSSPPQNQFLSVESDLGMAFANRDSSRQNIETNSVYSGIILNVDGSSDSQEEEIKEYIIEHSLTATMAHEGASFYLRLGCLVFAIANFLYVSLKIQYQRVMENNPDCVDKQTLLYPSCLHLIFLVLQKFFLFKNSKISASKSEKPLVRFGLMHTLATNLCVWLRILVREVMEAIHDNHISQPQAYGALPPLSLHADTEVSNVTGCVDDTLLNQASPYLFPFVLEYSLIAVATYCGMFDLLEVAVSKDFLTSVKEAIIRARKGETKSCSSKHGEHTSVFAKSHVGLFFGMLVLTIIVITIVLFYYWEEAVQDDDDLFHHLQPTILFHSTDLGVHVSMFIVVIVGLIKFFKLAFSLSRSNTIDHVLLLISMAGLVLFETFGMISNITYISQNPEGTLRNVSIIALVSGIFQIVQAIVQTVFIIDSMQKYSSSTEDQVNKPGRGAVTFLVITNLSMWLFKSFQVKQVTGDIHNAFYGSMAWAIILNINLPLLVFFRFHSSVCLADMWYAAYRGEESPVRFQYIN